MRKFSIMGYNFVIQPFHDFRKWETEGYRTRDAHFFQQLEKRKDVDNIIIINRPLSLAERILKGDSIKNLGTFIIREKFFSIRKIGEKSYVFDFYTPDFFNVVIQKRKWWDTIFRTKKITEKIEFGLKYLNIFEYILLVQNPMAIGLSERLNYKFLIFDVIDNWLEHPQMKSITPTIRSNYSEVEEKADLIISVSKNNKEIFTENLKRFTEITNGVDFDKFSVLGSVNFNTDTPIIGYIGKIQERFNLDLLVRLANLNKNYQFNIYGPLLSLKKEIKEVERKHQNINFIGEVSYEELPKIINTFDIGIIPHEVSKFTQSMNPLKLYEYLSCGVPVVSSKVNGVEGISQFVSVCSNDDEFIEKFSELIEKLNYYDKNEVRESLDKSFSWENKTQQLMNEIIKYE
ncbi:glycosyltransferase [Lactococcus lactis]|nr:glycosyltransferase [Lactococcus lactis]